MQPRALNEVIDGRYRLGRLIGRGGMADVRSGVDVRLHRPVAVKMLRAEWAQDAGMRGRFEDEARAAARLNHPHVVAVYDTGEHNQLPFIVMERLSGRSVADELDAGPLAVERVVTVAAQVLAALEAAHGHGIVHRDIKPANLLLTDNADVKVADFGIAKIAEGRDLTVTGFVVGTPAYLAPERIAGDPATPATDVYSVGVLLYRALTGRTPFAGDSPAAVLTAITSGAAPRLGKLRPDLDAQLVAAVERAMARDPAHRFASAADLRAALPEAISSRSDIEAAADATVVAGSVTEVLPAPGGAPRAVPVRVPDTVPPVRSMLAARRRTRWWLAALAVALLVVLVFIVPGDETGPPPTTAVSGATTIPEPLANAIDELERLVQP